MIFPGESASSPHRIRSILTWLTNLFPVWAALASGLALVHPAWFTWFSGPLLTWGLAVIMLGMGLTLKVDDFRRVARRPRSVAIGFVAQYVIMPSLGWALGRLLGLETPLAVGLILVACCPGGTASNVVSYIARADVALSVTMTACSTLAAIGMTPLLTRVLAGTLVRVDAWALCLDTLQVVLLPVGLGVALHQYAPRVTRAVLPASPLVSVIFIVLIVASVLGKRADDVRAAAPALLAAVGLLHMGGFGLGFWAARLCREEENACRTIAIEVGMQNSGLGTVLAQRNFPTLPTAALPCAMSAIAHSILGSFLAGWWRWRGLRARTCGPAEPASDPRAAEAQSPSRS